MVEIQVDGRTVEVPEGSMVLHAADKLGIYVPHFCYHKKLSIAANCRMCLVDVEKAPKPLPACATPVTAGMKVQTRSERAVAAQKGVMEFLLINHPLDCPICDQGGECQLQDLAMGYGQSSSRYDGPKRVVFHKPMGPLISAEEMTRCIHCTRCVRFGQEVAGQMELGMGGRGEHSEILSFVGRSVNSELSGNMIDLCPVGALTSKPFRYSARNWELSRRKSVSPHDSLGANLIVQIKLNRVMRFLPLENEAVNECWLSDRDRFSYEGLNSGDRLVRPMIKQDGAWREADWQTALEYAAHALTHVRDSRGPDVLGVLAAPHSTLEELHLAGQLARALGSDNVDFRLRQRDFSHDGRRSGAPWLGMSIAEVGELDRALLVGAFMRTDQPLLAARLRKAAKRGARVSVLHATDEDLLMPIAQRLVVAPSRWLAALAGIAAAVAQATQGTAPAEAVDAQPDEAARAIAADLGSGDRRGILMGNAVLHHPQGARLAALAQWIAQATGATFGWLGDSANAVGGYLAGAVPQAGGLNARAMLEQPRAAYVLLNCEPELDCADPQAARAALAAADTVIALTAYKSEALLEQADCLLPIAPFTETAGTFVNCEGRAQSFNGVVRPLGEARPGWKVLRVLGNLVGATGFEFDSAEQVRAAVAGEADVSARLDNAVQAEAAAGGAVREARRDRPSVAPGEAFLEDGGAASGWLERVADVPIYWTDSIVRRSPPLQQTVQARPPQARMAPATIERLALVAGDQVRLQQGNGVAVLPLVADAALPEGVVRVPMAHPATSFLGEPLGAIRVERA